jgi:arylsulfatase A-like enzyme
VHLSDHQLFFHGNSLYRQSVQVPLVIVGAPEGVPVGRTVAEPVGLNDLPATVIDLLGLRGRSPFPGRSMRRY